MNIKLLAADMDGTLLKEDNTISPRTQKVIRQWIDSGLLFVPCTGRPLCGLSSVTELFDEDMPFIIHHGAMAIMSRSKKPLFSVTLHADLVMEIYNLGEQKKLPMAIFCGEELYFNMECEPLRSYEKAVTASGTVADRQKIEQIARQGVIDIIWMDYPENIPAHQNEMQSHFGDRLNCHASGKWLFEFVAKEATKATGLEKLSSYLSISQNEIAAIGDSYNDISMLKYASYSIAMGNANDDIKKVCDHVTLTNDQDGVAIWMEDYMQKIKSFAIFK